MGRSKGKSPSFDAMVKFFMQRYEIPTKKDFIRLAARLEAIEKLLQQASRRPPRRPAPAAARTSAAEAVLAAIGTHPQGMGMKEIVSRTAYDAKKVRNIIYRLHREGRIERRLRGQYGLAGSTAAG